MPYTMMTTCEGNRRARLSRFEKRSYGTSPAALQFLRALLEGHAGLVELG